MLQKNALERTLNRHFNIAKERKDLVEIIQKCNFMLQKNALERTLNRHFNIAKERNTKYLKRGDDSL